MRKVEFAGDIFEETVREDGGLRWTCNKNKHGFKVVMNFTTDIVKHKQAIKAIERFIINTLSK